MVESIDQYNNDIVASARIKTGIFNPNPTAEFTFTSGKKLSISPTGSGLLFITIDMNNIRLADPGVMETSYEILIHGGRPTGYQGATTECLAVAKLMRVQIIKVSRNYHKRIQCITLQGDLDCDRVGKRLNFSDHYMKGIVPLIINVFPVRNFNQPIFSMDRSNEIELVVN